MTALFRRPSGTAAACAVAPYAAWMVLMTILPGVAWAYAVRTLATLFVSIAAFAIWRRMPLRSVGAEGKTPGPACPFGLKQAAAGVFVGVAVWAMWTFPERFETYRNFFMYGVSSGAESGPSPFDPAQCGWPLTIVRLCGSAFVIAAVEEVFFRGFLYRWIAARDWLSEGSGKFDLQAFLWTTALFALEHNRWLAGAFAGAAYAFLSIRLGLLAAILAHVVTNLILGLQVVLLGEWAYW